jgi:hypothetical protein
MRAGVLVVATVACGNGARDISVQAPAAVAVYANADGHGWQQLTATGSGAYVFQAEDDYEVGEECATPPSGSSGFAPTPPVTYEVLTTPDEWSVLSLTSCGALLSSPTWTLIVEMEQAGSVFVGDLGSASATGPWLAEFTVAQGRYDIAAADGARLAVVRDVTVDADTTTNVDLTTDSQPLETFPVTVSGGSGSIGAWVRFIPDQTVDDVVSPIVDLPGVAVVTGLPAQLVAVPPSAVERTDTQWLLVDELGVTGDSSNPFVETTVQTTTLDSHDLVLPPVPQLNFGFGRVAGTAIGEAASVSFLANVNTSVWMTRGWLDRQPNPSLAAFDDSFPAIGSTNGPAYVSDLTLYQVTPAETISMFFFN